MVGPTQRPVEEIHTAQEELRQAVAPVTRAMTAVPQTNPTRDAAAAEEAVLLSGRRLIAHLPLNPQMVERIIRGMLDTNQQQEYSQEITALTNLAAQANTPQAQRALRNAVEQLPELLQTIDRLREMGVTDGVTSLRNSFRRSLNTREPNEQIFNSAMQFCQSVLANREMINQDPQMIREIGEIFRRSNNPNLTNEFITDGFSQSTNRLQERIQNATAMLAERAERVAGRCDDLMESAQDTNLVRALSEMRDRANAIQNSLTGGRPISAETIQTIQSMERVAETTADIIQGRRVENRQVLSLCARAISLSNSQKEYGAEFCILMARAVVTGQIRADRSTMAEIENENPNYPALMRRILATLPTTNPEMAGAIARILNGMQDMQTPVRFFGLIEMTQRIRNDAPTIPRNFTAEQRNQYQQIVSRVIGIFAAANLDLSKAMEIYEVSREFLRTGQNEQRALIRAVEQGSESIQNVILLIRGRRQLGQILGNRTQCGEFFNSYRELNNQIERMISRYAAGEMVGQGAIENIRIVYALFFGNQNEIGQSVINPQRNNGTGAIYANYQTRLRNINDSISGLRGSQRTTAMRNYARAIEMVFAQGIDASTGALLLAQAYATNTRDREEIQNAINNQALNPQIQMDIGLAYINRGTSIPAIRNARAREVYDQVTRIQILDIYNNAGRGYSSIGTLADLVSLAAENRDSAMIERFANGFTTESGVRVPPLQTIIREMQEGSRGFSEVLLAHNQEFNYRGERSASRTQNVQGENATFVDRLNPASQLVALFTRDISAEEFGLEIGRLNTRTTQMRLDSRGVQSRYDAETRRLRTLAGSARNPALTLLYGREAEITSSERARARIETSRNALERARTLLQEAARYEVAAIRLSGREYEEAREECRRTTNREEQPIIIGILRARAADANARAHLLHQASLQLSNATYFIHRDVMISGEAHAGRFALNRSAENSEQVILEVTQSQGTRGQSFVRLQNSRLEIASADFVYGTNAVNRAIAIRNAVRIIDQNAQRIRRNIETVLSAITDSQGRIMRDRIVRRNANGTFTVVETNNELLDSRLLNEQLTRARRLAHSGNVNGAVGMLRETSTQLRIANIRAVVFRSHDGLLQRASRTEREAGRMEEFDIHSMIGVISGAEIDARERNFGSANETLEVFEQEVIPIAQARQNQLNAESSERDLERLHRTNAVNLRDAFRGTSLGLRARRDNALDEAAAQAEQDAQRALERAEQLRRSRLAIQRVEDIPVAETPNMILDALIEAGPQRGIGGIDRSYATHMRNLARASREGGNAVFEYLSQNPELLRRGLGILREQGNITQQAFDYMSAQSTHYQEHPESAHRMRRRNFAVRIAERQIEAMENIELLRRSGRIAPIEADAANGNISRLGEIGTFMIRADQRQFDQEMEGGAIAQRYTQITAEAIDVSESSIRGRGPALRTHELSLGLARRRTALDLPILGYEEVRNGGSNSYQRREFSAEQISQIERLNTINDRNIAQVTVVATTLTPQFSATNLTVTGAVSERNANEALDAIGRSSSIVQNAQSLIARRQTISERDRTQLDNYAEAARTQYYDSQEHVERGTRRERNFTRVASAAEVLGAGLLSASGLGTPVGIYFLSRSTFGFLDQARMAGGFDNLNEMQWAMGIGGIGLAGLGVMGSWTGGLFSELSGSGLASESFLLGLNRANLLLGRSMMAGGVVLGAGSMYEMYHSDPNANLFDYGLSFFMAAQPGLARGFAMAGEVNPSLIFGTSFRARAYRAAMTGFFGMGQHEMVQQYTARLYERVGALREALPEEVRRNVAIALAISGVHPSLEAQHEVLRFASEGGAQATRDPIELARAIRAFDNHAESSIDALGENAQTLIGGVEHALGRSLSAGEKLLLAEQLSAHPNMNPREMIIYLNDNRAATPTLEGFVQNHPEIARRQLPEETEFVQRPQQRRTREQPRDSLAGLRRASENRDLIIPESISTSEDIAHLARAVVREDPRAQRLIENLTQEQRRAVETLIRDPAFISLSGRNTREFNAFVRGNGLQVFGEEFAAFQSARPEVQHDQTIQPVTGEARTTRTREELVGRNENAQAAAEVGNNLRDETVAQNAQTLARELMFDNQGRRRGDRQLRSTLNSEAFAHRATELLGERAGQILNLLRRYENEPARIRTIGIGLMESNPIMRERYFEDLVSGLNQEGRVRIIRTPFSEQRRIEQNYTPEYAAELREAQVTRGFDAAENNLHGFGFNPQELRETHRREGFVGLGREMESRAHALEDTMTQAGQNANVSEIRQNLSFATAEHGPIDAQIQENLIRGYAFNGAEAVASRIRPEGEQRNALRAEIQEAFLRGGNFDSVLPILSREGVGAEQIAQLRDAFISGGTQSLRHSVQTARTEAVRTIETEGLRGFLQNRGIEYRMPPIDQTLSAEAATNGLRNFVDLVAQGNLEQTIRRIPGMENARITRVGYRHGLSGAYGVSVEIPGPTGPIERRVFVKTEDLAPAALGEELARNAGLLTAGHHVAEPFENGAIYANGEREQVNYGVMQDIHDLVGTWQRVSHPVREADGRIRMIEEEVFIESVALVADEIVDGEVTPRGQQAVNEYYDQMRTPEGREELFGGVYGYHRAAMEIGLGDRRAPNSGYAVGHTRDGRRVRTSSVAIDMDAVGMRIEPVIRNATHVRDQNGNIVHDLSVLHRDMGNATAEYLTGDYVETGIANYNNANPRNQIDVTSVEVAHSASRAIRNLEDVPAVSQEAQQRNAEVLERHNGQGFGLATPGRQLGVNSALSNQGELAQRPAPRADGRFTMRADEMQALHGELRSAESVQNHNRTERDAADFAVIYNGMFASEQLSASDARNFREVVATLYGSESSISWVGYGINDPTIEVEGTRINPLGYMIIRGRNISQQEMNRGFDTAVANGTFTPEQRAQYGEGYREYIRARLDIEVTAGRLSRENVDSFFRSADQLRGEVGLDIFDPNYVGRVSESLTRRTRTIPPESEVLEATPIITRMPTQAAPRRMGDQPVVEHVEELGAAVAVNQSERRSEPTSRTENREEETGRIYDAPADNPNAVGLSGTRSITPQEVMEIYRRIETLGRQRTVEPEEINQLKTRIDQILENSRHMLNRNQREPLRTLQNVLERVQEAGVAIRGREFRAQTQQHNEQLGEAMTPESRTQPSFRERAASYLRGLVGSAARERTQMIESFDNAVRTLPNQDNPQTQAQVAEYRDMLVAASEAIGNAIEGRARSNEAVRLFRETVERELVHAQEGPAHERSTRLARSMRAIELVATEVVNNPQRAREWVRFMHDNPNLERYAEFRRRGIVPSVDRVAIFEIAQESRATPSQEGAIIRAAETSTGVAEREISDRQNRGLNGLATQSAGTRERCFYEAVIEAIPDEWFANTTTTKENLRSTLRSGGEDWREIRQNIAQVGDALNDILNPRGLALVKASEESETQIYRVRAVATLDRWANTRGIIVERIVEQERALGQRQIQVGGIRIPLPEPSQRRRVVETRRGYYDTSMPNRVIVFAEQPNQTGATSNQRIDVYIHEIQHFVDSLTGLLSRERRQPGRGHVETTTLARQAIANLERGAEPIQIINNLEQRLLNEKYAQSAREILREIRPAENSEPIPREILIQRLRNLIDRVYEQSLGIPFSELFPETRATNADSTAVVTRNRAETQVVGTLPQGVLHAQGIRETHQGIVSETENSLGINREGILLELPQGATNVEGRGRSPAAVLGNDITPTQVRVDLPDGSQYRFDGAVRVGEETYVRFTRKKGNETNSVYVRQVDPATTQAQQRVAHYREGITRAVEQIAQREAAAQTPEPTQLQQPTQGTSTQPRIITNEEIVGRVLDMTLAHHEEEERVQVRQMVETNDPEWDRVRRRAGMEITDDNSTVFRMLWNLAREVQLGTLTIERVREVYPDYAEAISRLGRYNSDQIGGQLAHEANLIVERRGGPQVIAMRELVRRATERGMSAELAASLYAPAVRYAQQHENNPHFQNLVRDEIFSSRFHGETISINARVIEVAADVVHRATEIQRAATRSGETEDLRIGGVFATRVARENGRERPNTEDCLRAAPISLAISREIVRETSWGIGYSRDARAFVEGAREIIQTAPIGRVEEAFDTYSSTVAYARRAQDGYEFFGNTPEQIARSNEAREDIYFIAARMAVANPEAARSILHGDGFGQVSFNIHSLFPRPQFAAESVNEATIAIAQIIRNTPEQDQAAAGNFIRMMLEDARRLPEGLRQIYIMATASNYHHSPELMGAVQTYDAQARDNGALVRATPGNDFAPRRIRRLPMLAEALGRNPEIAQGRENPFRNLDGKWARQAMPNDQTYAQITNMLINYSQVRATHQAAIEDGLLNEGVPADATRIQMRPRESLARIGDAAALGRAFGYEHQGYARRGGIDYAIFRENGSTREIMVQMVQEGAHQPGEVMTYYESVFRVANVERINRTTEETLAQLGTTRGREAEGVRSDFLGRRMRIINSVYEFAGAGTITHEQLREFVTQTTMHPERFNEASTQLFRALIPTVQLNETWIGQNVDLFLDFVSHRINLNRLAAGGAERVSGHTGTSPQYERAVQLLDRAIEAHANGRFAEFKFTPEFRAELEEVCAIAHIDVNRLWNTWTAEGQFNIQIGEGENRRTMRVLETGGFERSFRYGQVAGNEACQVIRNDHPVVGGVVGSIAQPWIRQIVIPIEGSNQSAFRQTLTMVINQDGRPVIIAQPAYGLRDMPAEQRSAIQAQVIDYLRTRYETIGVEVRLFQQENAQILPGSEMNPAYISAEARELPNGTRIEAGRPINHGFMTFRLRAPFVYMDSNSRSFPGGGRNGFYSGEIGERIMFPFRSAQ